MEGWTLFFMIVVLKIPLIAALWLIWYAVKEPAPGRRSTVAARVPGCIRRARRGGHHGVPRAAPAAGSRPARS
jgi:hypothetical protein